MHNFIAPVTTGISGVGLDFGHSLFGADLDSPAATGISFESSMSGRCSYREDVKRPVMHGANPPDCADRWKEI
jgi:hypothetical protein